MTIQELREQIDDIVLKAQMELGEESKYRDQILSLDGLLFKAVCPKCNGSGSWYQPDIEPYNPCDRCETKGYVIIPTKDLV